MMNTANFLAGARSLLGLDPAPVLPLANNVELVASMLRDIEEDLSFSALPDYPLHADVDLAGLLEALLRDDIATHHGTLRRYYANLDRAEALMDSELPDAKEQRRAALNLVESLHPLRTALEALLLADDGAFRCLHEQVQAAGGVSPALSAEIRSHFPTPTASRPLAARP